MPEWFIIKINLDLILNMRDLSVTGATVGTKVDRYL
jgi:hypothetical protein